MARLAILLALAAATSIQQLATLKIKVTVVDADGHVRPVPRHALLISDNPVSAAPERVVTSIEGLAEIRLKPGNYTVESDEPLIFQGKAYEWTQTLDLSGGRDTTLELTTANAQVGAPSAASGGATPGGSASALLIDWQDSVVSIWTPTRLGSGFVIDARGLILTNQRLVGGAPTAEVQFSPVKKVAARVLAADANRDVAILWIDPAAIGSARPMKLGFARDGTAKAAEKDKVFALEAPLNERKSLASGTIGKVTAHAIVTNVSLDERSAGAPIMNASGEVIAISTLSDDDHAIHDVSTDSIRIDEARPLIADAEQKMANVPAPSGAPLPLEPERAFEDEALREAVKGRAGRLGAYIVTADDFDIGIITPVMLYGSRHREDRATGRGRGQPAGNPEEMLKSLRALQEFANWDDYVFDYPPVVMIRVTPKLVEGFWTSLGRAAAQSQGVDISASKRLKAPFSRMRLSCGDAEVTPIHPFRIERRVGARDVIYEGLYVFDPDTMTTECKTVKLTIFSEKDPEKGDTRTIDPKILQQVRDDFAPYRAATPK